MVFDFKFQHSVANTFHAIIGFIVVYCAHGPHHLSLFGELGYNKVRINGYVLTTNTATGLQDVHTWMLVCQLN